MRRSGSSSRSRPASLARGYSGIRWSVIEALVAVANAGILPCIPAQGSVGASGDLAPLAHLAGVLIGEGEAKVAGRVVPARDALAGEGLEPVVLGPKEGLALLNGTQVSTALALAGLFAAERAVAAAFVAGALAVDACLGSDTPFDPRIHAVRAHRGQGDAAAIYRALLAHSSIRASHKDCPRVQDPYSLRCQPQVMGACLDQMRHAAGVMLTEANAVSDNPLVFAGAKAGPAKFSRAATFTPSPSRSRPKSRARDRGNRRAVRAPHRAADGTHLSGLPPFLVADGGVNSGFMIAQVTAAALASENKSLAHPASVDSLPTSANQEDHVSMATYAARRLGPMAANTAGVVAIELLAATQGVDLRKPLATSPRLAEAMALIRERVAFWDRDRAFAPDLAAARELVEGGAFLPFVGAAKVLV